MSPPLAPHVIEALAHGREELLTEVERSDVARVRADAPAWLDAEVARERDASRAFGRALARAAPDVDVDALVMTAMTRAERSTERASTRALAIGGALGVLLATTSLALALALADDAGLASVRRVASLFRAGVTLSLAGSRAIEALPGGVGGLALLALATLGGLALALRRLDLGLRAVLPSVLVLLLSPTVARAYELEGTLRVDPLITVDVDRAPRSSALTAAARSAGLGLAYTLEADPPVTLHVRAAPLSQVLAALLPGDELVEASGQMLVVRAPRTPPLVVLAPERRFEPTLVEPSWAALAPPPPPPVFPSRPAMPANGADLRDVLTFGRDAHVARNQDVRDVVTAGGDATVDGRAFGSVLTMGGDAEISGTVVGDVVTMGGDIRVTPSGRVHGRLDAMGGEVQTEGDHATSALALPSRSGEMEEVDGGALVWALLRYSLLFLLALAFVAVSPERFGRLSRAIVERPVRVLATGGLGLVGGLTLFAVLLVSLVGIPFALVLLVGSPLAVMMGLAAVVGVVGSALPIRRLEGRPVARLAAGALALFVVTRIPVVGGLVIALALLAGVGALLLTRFGEREVAPPR